MRNLLVLSFSILFIQNIFAQENIFEFQAEKDSIEFIEVLKLFDGLRVNGARKYSENIPFKSYYKFFHERYNEYVVGISPVQILNNSNNITLIVEIGGSAGGYSCSFKLATFKPNGELVSSRNIGFIAIDNDGGPYCKLGFIDNKFLEILEYETVNVNDRHKVTGEVKKTYYFFDQNGYKIIDPKYSISRLFPCASTEVLREGKLLRYSIEQLDVMRNEIFADYGYRFSTDKWREYFENKFWYEASYDNVNEFLTEIEKYNINLILKVKENKQ